MQVVEWLALSCRSGLWASVSVFVRQLMVVDANKCIGVNHIWPEVIRHDLITGFWTTL
jgi:hypothetical protein